MAFAELSALSNFSFLKGASHPEEYVDRAASMGPVSYTHLDVYKRQLGGLFKPIASALRPRNHHAFQR